MGIQYSIYSDTHVNPYLKQKHQRCKKVQGQSEAAIIDQKV